MFPKMICRLCLTNIEKGDEISLFDEMLCDDASKMVKLISIFIDLEITQNDALSTTVCQKCYVYLDEFNKFCMYIEQQQLTLQRKLEEVQCDIPLVLEETEVEGENIEGEELPVSLPNEERECAHSIRNDGNSTECDDDISFNGEEFEDFAEIIDEGPVDSVEEVEYVNSAESNNGMTLNHVEIEDYIENDEEIFVDSLQQDYDQHYIASDYQDDSARTRVINQERVKKKVKMATDDDDDTTSTDELITDKKSKNGNRSHGDEKDEFIANHMQLKCDICDIPFQNFTDVIKHFRKCHDCRPYVVCCGSRMTSRIMVYNHVIWHLDPKHFKCEECNKYFKNNVILSFHYIRVHKKYEDLTFECTSCDKSFSRQWALNQHVKSQHMEKTFKCGSCDNSYVNQGRLDRHIKAVHEDFFPHICDKCGKKFKTKPSFSAHILEHQGKVKPPVQCRTCGEWKKNKISLYDHIQHIHGGKDGEKCKYCDKIFTRKTSLKEHEASHTGIYLYNCPHCLKCFRSHANMYTHIKQIHPDEWLKSKSTLKSKKDNATRKHISNLRLKALNKNVKVFNIVKEETAELFPIDCEENLAAINNDITDDNEKQFISTIKCLLNDNIGNLHNILSRDLAVNYHGFHGMELLSSFQNFYSALLNAIELMPTAEGKDPYNLLKHGIYLQKRRAYKKEKRQSLMEFC